MKFGIGIDTGGTFTDSVIIDLESGRVISKAKALTTKNDLKIGVENSLAGLDWSLFEQVKLVSLSTTLATNSVVEAKGSRVGLITAVPNPATFAFSIAVPAEEIAVIAGAHNKNGEVVAELDICAAAEAIKRMSANVDAFAVSSYFSIYNADYELRIKEIITSLCDYPVVCGHELSGQVGMVERATTAVLNAKLLPVIRELIEAARSMLRKHQIDAPLMVVKGDGSLISEETALDRPVETVLSGPAASVVGACRLTGLSDAIVVDMGGTTTDIAVVQQGNVDTSNEGAVIGGWKTRVKAADIWTVGLGGDSRITVASAKEVKIGPRRVIPLCAAAQSDPSLKNTLVGLVSIMGKRLKELDLDFYTLMKEPGFKLTKYEQKLVDALSVRVLHKSQINDEIGPFIDIHRFVEIGSVAEVSFTPTDLLHARGDLNLWDQEISDIAAQFLAAKAGLAKGALLELLYDEIIESLKLNITAKALFEDNEAADRWSGANLAFLGYLLRLNGQHCISANMALKYPVVAVGAPVEAYFPRAVAELGSKLVIPEHSEVANAVGAVTGRVIERADVYIRYDKADGFLVIAPNERRTFALLSEAEAFAEEYAKEIAVQRSIQRGGADVEITLGREEHLAPLATGWGDSVFLELKITATAIGRPVS